MKQSLLLIAVLTTALTAGHAFQAAQVDASPGKDRPKLERGEGRDDQGVRQAERMARELGLSAEQQEQIRAIVEEHRAKAEPLRQSLEQNRARMREAVKAQNFDEAAVRGLVADQMPVKSELMVERARMKNQIHNLLTPEQQALAEARMQERGGRYGKKGW